MGRYQPAEGDAEEEVTPIAEYIFHISFFNSHFSLMTRRAYSARNRNAARGTRRFVIEGESEQ